MLKQFYPVTDPNQQSFVRKFKLIFLLALVLFSTTLQAKTYYVSSSGNNSNNGTSTSTPWQTISKVNSFSFASGDIILFQRGNTFYGGIIAKRSNLTYGAYGTGANPVITGLSTVNGWVKLSTNIWEAPVSNVKSGVNLVLRNSTIQQVGRYPNTDAADGGYLTYTKSTNKSVTGPAQSSTTNWTGAEIAIKVNRWSISRQKVTAHSGGTVTFTTNPDVPRLNYGYFFQRDSRTLDRDGEWWHNVSGKKLRMFFSNNNPGSYTVQIATVDTLFKSQNYSNITVTDLSFTGSGKRSIWINAGSTIAVKNCNVTNSGGEAITVKGATNVTVDNCTTTNSLGAGISVFHAISGTVNFLIQHCTVLNTAYIPGMELSNEGGGEGLRCVGGSGVKVYYNKVTNSGYSGIEWQGNNAYIKYNLVDRYCFIRDDGAGIYSFEDPSKTETRVNRNIISNIVLNGIGNNQGTNDNYSSVQGLYFDLGSKSVIADSNTVAYVTANGIHGNNCGSLTFRNNVVFGNGRSFSFQRFAGAALIRSITITNNIVYPYRLRYRNLGINDPSMTKEADMKAMGTIDNNYYSQKPGTDTSLNAVTTYADNSNYKEVNMGFSYITGTVGMEKNSTKFANNATLEFNASSSPKVVNFSGQSKKDVFGKVYNNSVTIPAWSSKVLIPNGSTSTTNKPPVANAGAFLTIVLPINTATLTGKGTDADGTITKYAWAKISGPSTGTIVSPGAAVTGLLNLVAGVYKYQLTVTDNLGATGKDTVQVTVSSTSVYLHPAVNPTGTLTGLNYRYYEGSWLDVPKFGTLTPIKTGSVSNFDLTPRRTTLNYGFNFTGYINVPADGVYTFYVSSDDGSNLLIDNVMVVANGGLHGPEEKSGVIGLKAGKHILTLGFFQRGGGSSLVVNYQSSSISKRAVPSSAFTRINPTAPPPVASRIANGMIVDSLNRLNTDNNLKISSFPNPSTTEFGLLVEGGNNEKIEITVLSADGRIVFQNTTTTTNKTYKFGNKFMPGMYIIKVVQGNNIQTLKVIKL